MSRLDLVTTNNSLNAEATSLLASGAVAAGNGKTTGNNRKMIVGLTTFASIVLFGTIIGVEEARKKPMGLSTNTPVPTPAPNTPAPAARKRTDSVTFTTNSSNDFVSNTSGVPSQTLYWPYTESCTEVLAANDKPGGASDSDLTMQGIATAVLDDAFGPACYNLEQLCDPVAATSGYSPIGTTIGPFSCVGVNEESFSGSSSFTFSGSSGIYSETQRYADPGKIRCVMDSVRQIFNEVVEGCRQVELGNMTAVCGQNEGSALFNVSKTRKYGAGYAIQKDVGFFTCSGKGNHRKIHEMKASNYPANTGRNMMPLRANNHR